MGICKLTKAAGVFYATAFNLWSGKLWSGNSTTGVQSVVVFENGFFTLQDGTQFNPFSTNAPVIFDVGSANAETLTPSVVSGLGSFSTTEPPTGTLTANFAHTHGRGAVLKSGTFGLQEAINAAAAAGGGVVVVDAAWATAGGTTAILLAATPDSGGLVLIEDRRGTQLKIYGKIGSAYQIIQSTVGLVQQPVVYSGTVDAIAYPGLALITSTGVDAATLGTPSAGTDDGKMLTVIDTGGHAHTLTTATGKIVSGSTQTHRTGTFSGNAGAQITLLAYGGLWYVIANANGAAGVAVALT